jgi:hypothetical protein
MGHYCVATIKCRESGGSSFTNRTLNYAKKRPKTDALARFTANWGPIRCLILGRLIQHRLQLYPPPPSLICRLNSFTTRMFTSVSSLHCIVLCSVHLFLPSPSSHRSNIHQITHPWQSSSSILFTCPHSRPMFSSSSIHSRTPSPHRSHPAELIS